MTSKWLSLWSVGIRLSNGVVCVSNRRVWMVRMVGRVVCLNFGSMTEVHMVLVLQRMWKVEGKVSNLMVGGGS